MPLLIYTSFNLQWSTPVTNGDCDIVKYYIYITPGDMTISSTVNETTVTVINGTGSYTLTVSGTDSVRRLVFIIFFLRSMMTLTVKYTSTWSVRSKYWFKLYVMYHFLFTLFL